MTGAGPSAAASGPIFLLAYERSGTNLLRRILRASPDVDGPSPTQLMTWLGPLEPYYGDLRDDDAFRLLVEDAIGVTALPLQPWGVVLSAEEAVATIAPEERSLVRLLGWLNDRHAHARGKRRWFCKDKKLVHHAHELALAFPDAQFVYLARDPRDVFASYRKAPGGPRHPHPFAVDWARDQEMAIRVARSGVLRSRTLELTYEGLLADPEATVRALCAFLVEEFRAEMLSPSAGEGIDTSSGYWQNLGRDILRGNAGSFRETLRRSEVRVIEERAWGPMHLLGYRPEAARGAAPASPAGDLLYRLISALRARRNREAGSEADRATRRRRQAFRQRLNARFGAGAA